MYIYLRLAQIERMVQRARVYYTETKYDLGPAKNCESQ